MLERIIVKKSSLLLSALLTLMWKISFMFLGLSGSAFFNLNILLRFSVFLSPSCELSLSSITRFICAFWIYALRRCRPSCLKSPSRVKVAMIYSARKKVSICGAELFLLSIAGFLSMMAVFLSTRVVKGFIWIFSKRISPSSFFDRASTALCVNAVWTCGNCIAIVVAHNTDRTVTSVSQNILSAFLMTVQFLWSNLQK